MTDFHDKCNMITTTMMTAGTAYTIAFTTTTFTSPQASNSPLDFEVGGILFSVLIVLGGGIIILLSVACFV